MLERLAIDASRSNAQQRTGTEWYSARIVDALVKLEERPDITLYQRPGTPELSAGGVQTVTISRDRLWTHLGLSAAVRRDEPDALFVPSHVIPVIHPKVNVVTVHDLGYRYETSSHTRQRRLMLEATTRWNARVATRIIAISNQTRDDLWRHYDVPPEKVDVIHHGLDHERFRVLHPSDYQDRLDRLEIEQPYVLFLSTLQPRKNVIRLIEALERLRDLDLTLVLAGKTGWLAEPILQRIRESTARIRLLGHVADDDVPALYNGASVFALPSLYEGFGMGILEAMACGCPVVTSDRASMPEVAGGAAVLADPSSVDAIAEGLATAIRERAQLIQAGLKRAQDFHWDVTARETLRTIERAWQDVHG